MIKPFSTNTLHEQAEQVSSAEELAGFIRVLLSDYRHDDGDWTNMSLGLYLRGMAAWIEDRGGCHENGGLPDPQKAEWQTFAQILLAAKDYE